jgi:hypothetical protein
VLALSRRQQVRDWPLFVSLEVELIYALPHLDSIISELLLVSVCLLLAARIARKIK